MRTRRQVLLQVSRIRVLIHRVAGYGSNLYSDPHPQHWLKRFNQIIILIVRVDRDMAFNLFLSENKFRFFYCNLNFKGPKVKIIFLCKKKKFLLKFTKFKVLYGSRTIRTTGSGNKPVTNVTHLQRGDALLEDGADRVNDLPVTRIVGTDLAQHGQALLDDHKHWLLHWLP